MKKTSFFMAFLGVLMAQIAFSQPPGEKRRERIEAFRVAFITERLNLSSSEAEKFWPIWNEYSDARERLRDQFKMDKDIDAMTDAEVEEFLNKHLEGEQKELDLRKDALTKLRKVLPARKVARLPRIEREFKEELLKKIQKRAGDGPPPNRPKGGKND